MVTQKPFAELDSLCASGGDRWCFTFYGGSLEHEALSTYGGNSGDLARQPKSAEFAMPLAQAQMGDRLRVISLRGRDLDIQHLHQLGVCSGTEFQVISRRFSGSVVVLVGETRLGLGRWLAKQVVVALA